MSLHRVLLLQPVREAVVTRRVTFKHERVHDGCLRCGRCHAAAKKLHDPSVVRRFGALSQRRLVVFSLARSCSKVMGFNSLVGAAC